MGRRRAQSSTERYRVRCEQTPEGDPFIKLPDALMESLHWKIGDVIEWRQCRSSTEWEVVNLSARVLYASRFRRNLQSLTKALNNPRHPLLRVGIKCHPSNRVSLELLPADRAFQHTNKKHIQKIIDVHVKAFGVLGSIKNADEWLHAPALELNGQRPIDILNTPQGAESINTLLDRMEYGVYT